jgi:ribosomal protein L3
MTIKAKKVKMTQIWDETHVIPVTVLSCDIADGASIELEKGEKVSVTGISKGRGFQGVVKRHGFHGGPKTHGQKDRLRAPGSNDPTAPQRVIKGRKMAGHMGVEKVTEEPQGRLGERRREDCHGRRGRSRQSRGAGHDREEINI